MYGFDSIETLSDEQKATLVEVYSQSGHVDLIEVSAPAPLPGGRIVFALDTASCPKTCDNFLQICMGGKVGKASKKPLHYKNSTLFRLVKDYIVQGGDVTRGDGSGGDSIYNGKFNDEKPGLAKKFDRKGLLAMANSGKNTNTSQFFITLAEDAKKMEKMNGKYVVFGEVVEGVHVLDEINKVPTKGETPLKTITVTDCGKL
ncbi:hypothetical protein BZG36_04557 [Bifiguratus adelaidae]|uniref:Peptidyl-prolyl cis-trans isomerase n=1 Tax=Bifiguratus adelaidae TaxID=1938954 RepID=A0A261XXG4_9FUNG|nr:hypothetical protein BZG36_04557 [Bifiguratus adelaidae]